MDTSFADGANRNERKAPMKANTPRESVTESVAHTHIRKEIQMREEWYGFKEGRWVNEINVRSFIHKN